MKPIRWRMHKYQALPAEARKADGFTFDSQTERDYYLYLVCAFLKLPGPEQVIHIDVHPKVTLGPGDRVEPDFLVWYADGRVEFHDVKSTHPERLREFRRLQRRWRHPGGPLVGIIRRRKAWERIDLDTPEAP